MTKYALIVAGALAGCHAHDEKAADESPAFAVTHYAEATELFVEFPPLVRGEQSAFAAHLTRLADFKPVAEGTLTAVLSGGGAAEERVSAPVSGTPGIFRPAITPRHAGKRSLRFELASAGLRSVHELGEFDVAASKAGAEAPPQGPQGIRFTKEQQWQIDFAVAPAALRVVRPSIPVNALVRARASGEAQLAAPAAGIVRAGPGGFPELGRRMAQGEVLGYLAPRLGGETDAASLELAVRRARIEAEQASGELKRLEALLVQEAVAQKRVAEARARHEIAQAEVRAAERRVAVRGGEAGGIVLKAPVAGTVVAVSAAPGAYVESGAPLLQIADLSRLWLEARVPEADAAKIGTPAGAFFRLGEETIVLEAGRNARLVAFGGMVDPQTRTVPAIFEFANPAGRLRLGTRLSAQLLTGSGVQGVAVPASALVDEGAQSVLYVQSGGETFERRPVIPGARDGDWVAIGSGLQPGERVVTRGAYQVRLAAAAPAAAGRGHTH